MDRRNGRKWLGGFRREDGLRPTDEINDTWCFSTLVELSPMRRREKVDSRQWLVVRKMSCPLLVLSTVEAWRASPLVQIRRRSPTKSGKTSNLIISFHIPHPSPLIADTSPLVPRTSNLIPHRSSEEVKIFRLFGNDCRANLLTDR